MLTLDKLNDSVLRPTYDRSHLLTRMAHIGFGAFHRAHQAVCTDRLAAEQASDWGYCEISLFSGEQIANIRAQDCLWSVSELEGDKCQSRVIGVATSALSVPADGNDAVLDALCTPDIAIVSMTVTEKGYCYRSSTGELDVNNELITHDIANPQSPRSTPGLILEAIRRRRNAGLAPFSVMSCDNMPNNGRVTRDVILQLARLRDPQLSDWIGQNIRFPSTMVDRIVPAVTPEAMADIESHLGVHDPAGVQCEPFFQWVIEDNFVSGRPSWELAGATLVDNVLPYEEMKLRMLNGSHSFLAYLGYLAGYAYISDCMEDTQFSQATRLLMLNEQAQTLTVDGINLEEYADSLIQRFENKALKHRTWQIAMDGSLKLPQRMLDSIRWHLANGSRFDLLALGVAAWIRYASGTDEQGRSIDVRDPLAQKFALLADNTSNSDARVHAFLSLESIFGQDLSANDIFVESVTGAYASLLANGARQTLADALKVLGH